MRYLIVGGTSTIGEDLVDELLKKESTEAVICTKLPGERGFERKNLDWYELDLRNVDQTNNIIGNSKADIIFDLASQDSVGYSWDNPTETVDINVVGTINLLNAVRDYSAESRVIIGGSGEEYGRLEISKIPVSEEVKPVPNNIYGATKACQTLFAKLYHQAYKLDIIVLRAFYVTSVKQDDKFAISSFCKQFVEMEKGKKPKTIFTGNVGNIRDFTDALDLVNAFIAVSEKGKSGEVYNAGGGRAVTLLQVIRELEKITGITVDIRMDADRVRPMDSPAVVADISKIEEDTGWKPEIPLSVTIEKLYTMWKEKLN